jgi:serine/threonine-protein kinase 24/25/MST4
VDIWSFGITLYEFVMGEPPNSSASPTKAMQMAVANPPATLDEKYSKQFKEFLAACLIQDPANVISFFFFFF